MRMINYALLAGAALFAATAANATTTITFFDGLGNLQPGEVSYADFNTVATSGSPTGSNFVIQTGTNAQGAQPVVGDQGDPYLSVGSNLPSGIATFNFASQPGGGIFSLGMDYGSADEYNSFVLHLSNGTTEIYTGGQVIAAAATGNRTSPVTNGRLTFRPDAGLYITSIDLRSTGQALEVDNFGVISVAAVPEPATWGMMLLGFGVMGVSLRRRRRSLPSLAQAV